MRNLRHPKALLISLGVYLTFFTVSVNPPERTVQANEQRGQATLYLYFLGGLTHIGLGLDVLDEAGRPVSVRVWDYGSRNHYSYKDEEWVTGKRNWFGSLNNLSLLWGTTEGEMRSWDPTVRFGITLEEFKRSKKLKTKLPISRQQWQALNTWLHAQTTQFRKHDRYEDLNLDIWFGDGVPYHLFKYNCATFLAQALYEAQIFTEDNVPRNSDQLESSPSRWLFPPNMIAHYRTHPLLSAETVERRVSALQRQHLCVQLHYLIPAGLSTVVSGVCTLI